MGCGAEPHVRSFYMSNLLVFGGIAVAGISVAGGIVAMAVLWISKRRINAQLDAEYGKKQ